MDRYDRPNTRWRTYDEIVQIVILMQNDRGPTIRMMRDILDRYDGDWVIPIPSVSTEPVLPPLIPALIAEAIDSKARRAASRRPTVVCPAIDANKDTGRRSRAYALTRRKIISATYERSRWKLGARRFYRQLSAYETGSICVVPDFDMEMPAIEVRDPLGTFVEPQAWEQLRDPEYVAFVCRYSGAYLRRKYPQVRSEVGGPITNIQTQELWDVVEWYDVDQMLWGLVGPVHQGSHVYESVTSAPWMQISPAYPNKIGMLPCVVPHNVSLGKIASRIGSLIGMVDVQAKLAALDIIAQEKAIFPDLYGIAETNQIPMIVGGKWKDGREGEINLIQGVREIGQLRSTPDQRTSTTIDRQERNFRISTGLLPQTGGESFSALRTGRAMDSMFAASIDPIVQEMHEIYESYVSHMNSAILATWKGYKAFSGKQSFFSGWPGDRGIVEFTPSEHIETYANTVTYAYAGADVVEATQVIGSLMGAGMISRASARMQHPMIDDPDHEGKLVESERLEDAVMEAIAEQVRGGQLPLLVLTRIQREIAKGTDLSEAVRMIEEEAQRIQASQPPAVPPGMAAAPEQMPGLAAGPQAFQAPAPQPPVVDQQVLGDVSQMRALQHMMGR